MKIYATIRNYGGSEPTEEILAHDKPFGEGEEPLFYTLPDSSLLRTGNPFFVPDFDTDFRLFPSLCIRVGRLGKGIARRFAHRYMEGWTAACAVVARGVLEGLRRGGLPWERATSFDRSCFLGNLQPIATLNECGPLRVTLGERAITYDMTLLRHGADELIERLSRDNTLKNGDLILAGLTPQGLPLNQGERLRIDIETTNLNLIDINLR